MTEQSVIDFFFLLHRKPVWHSMFLVVTESWSSEQGIPPWHFQGHLANKVGGLILQTATYSYFQPFCSTVTWGVKLDTDLAHY